MIISLLSFLLLLSGCNKGEKDRRFPGNPTKVIDTFVPEITIINKEITVDEEEYDYAGNTDVKFGRLGGSVDYEVEKNDNKITVNVIAKGNNGLTSTDSFILNVEKTKGKTMIVFGDSIVYGIYANRYSFANYLNDNYDFKKVVNAGYSDYRLSVYDDPNKWLIDAVKRHYDGEYDYILLEGGVNDVLYETPLGVISKSKDYDSFNIYTFCGGMEAYLYTITERWPNAKIGYIITYYTKGYTERGLSWTYEDYKTYYDLQKQILDKWGIPYLDLFADEFSQLLEVGTTKYIPDRLHLNRKGHQLITPYIYEWLKGLKRYS